jgi:alpha-tubulin suppressor-like RCC1 family protein
MALVALAAMCTPLLAGNDVGPASDAGGGDDSASSDDQSQAGQYDASARHPCSFTESDGGCLDAPPSAPPWSYNPAPLVSSWNLRTCAVVDASVYCWGDDHGSVPGDDAASAPSLVSLEDGGALTGVVQVAVGYQHMCVLRDGGDILCWGDQRWGETGFLSATPRTNPGPAVPAPDGVRFTSVVAKGWLGASPGDPQGGLTCAVDGDGGAWCWGMTDHAALGHPDDGGTGLVVDGATLPSNPTPTRIQGIPETVVQIELDDAGGCALTAAQNVYCWGWNADAELGDPGGSGAPVRLTMLASRLTTGFMAISQIWGGHATLCGQQKFTRSYCWGSNFAGQLGLGAGAGSPQANPVVFGGEAGLSLPTLDVAIGWGHVCVLLTDRSVRCAGWNGEYELGTGSLTDDDAAACAQCQSTPAPVVGSGGAGFPLSHVVQLSAGWAHTCARTDDGLVYCWGYNGDPRSHGATGHPPGTMGDVPCAPPPFLTDASAESGAFCTPYPTVVSGLGPVK